MASGRRLNRRLTSDVATLSLPPVSGMANRRSEGRCGLDDMSLKYSADRAPSKVDSRSSTMVGFEANERRHEEVDARLDEGLTRPRVAKRTLAAAMLDFWLWHRKNPFFLKFFFTPYKTDSWMTRRQRLKFR